MIVIHFSTSARGDIVPEKRQNEMLKVDSAEFSAQEGHTDAVILGVRRCAMLRIAQSSSGCSKRHGVQRYPLQPWSRDRWRLQHRQNIGNIWEILEIFGKYWKYLGNIGNIWLQPWLLQLRRKAMNWFLLRRERSEPQLKTTIHCRMSCSCRSTERYAADRYGPLEARTGWGLVQWKNTCFR